MGWIVVKQPNEKYAIFSTVVDHFIFYNGTREQTKQFIIEDRLKDIETQVEKMVQTADNDSMLSVRDIYGDGTNLWHYYLDIIRNIHGKKELEETAKAVETGDYSYFGIEPEERDEDE